MSTITLPTPELNERPTEHPHIVSVNGTTMLRGSRIRLRLIAQMYRAGDNVEDILHTYPHLSAAVIHDAISYFLDHRTEIEQEIASAQIEIVMADMNARLDGQGFVRFATKPSHD